MKVSRDRAAGILWHSAGRRTLLDPHDVETLVTLMVEQGLRELEIERSGTRLRLVRAEQDERAVSVPARRAESRDSAVETARPITSPMVGTFHRAPASGAAAFVDAGDVVERGQVLCLIEAMKMMNEIEAEFRGRVTQVLIENGAPVEYGEALFLVEPV